MRNSGAATSPHSESHRGTSLAETQSVNQLRQFHRRTDHGPRRLPKELRERIANSD
jgi:hypothetical protein